MEETADTADQARQLASREATEWLILLQEDPGDDNLRRRFEVWRAASPLNEAAWATTRHVSGMVAATTPAHADKWRPFVAGQRGAARTQAVWAAGIIDALKRRWLLATMGTAVAAALALVVAPAALVQLRSDYTTGTAALRHLELQDGSEVTLAPASAIAVSYEAGERRVRLLQGEAFFQVKPDKARPFRVVAGDVQALVVGTSFDVRWESGGVSVAVQEGVVQVGASEGAFTATERLEAGQSVKVLRKGEIRRADEPPHLIAGWRQGQLLAQDRSLRDAVEELRRYWGGAIILTDDALGDLRITGAYNLDDPEEALRGMARAHGAKVRRVTLWVLVVSGS
ncbi:FecR domain-containing protein [Reyranella sp.]|uniref:FecR family protein n=1 Tax=Reyranella sp. TaxID=1929291 RepID=UPI0012217179|nr:FecR domain-containing protein [Reyranella sp.]TAJ88175.1 MAG: DUF4880 domain-containing protein [Reyranella sp.]